ncbi:hypothetical protein [Rubeoparvulum massiliense]|uniref:hypothetical protein n=1 Tax=Rubeoparvulum massiliense TaxID=1631346 RepID=UPI00065E81EE|nr:hypothetical protein [Rubeoparvulum massiliense]
MNDLEVRQPFPSSLSFTVDKLRGEQPFQFFYAEIKEGTIYLFSKVTPGGLIEYQVVLSDREKRTMEVEEGEGDIFQFHELKKLYEQEVLMKQDQRWQENDLAFAMYDTQYIH